jgi:hypothetical protein
MKTEAQRVDMKTFKNAGAQCGFRRRMLLLCIVVLASQAPVAALNVGACTLAGDGRQPCPTVGFSTNVLGIVTLSSKRTRALTLQHFCKGGRTDAAWMLVIELLRESTAARRTWS